MDSEHRTEPERSAVVSKHRYKFPHLLQRIHAPRQHVQVIEGGDGGGQMTLGVI